MTKKVAVLGSTGSIGTNALDVIARKPDEFAVWGLSANTNWRLLAQQARRFEPEFICVADEAANGHLKGDLPSMRARFLPSGEFARKAAEEADIVLVAVVGTAGLEPTLAAAGAGKRVALANKESLVMAGGLVMEAARRSGAEILPVDSEHSALFQALQAGDRDEVKRAVITASGGPFLDRPADEFDDITVEEALSHPTWSMGRKITIDSATMVNKAFEVIEARWLFDLDAERIAVLVHPESIVHALVEFDDGSVIAQMSLPDMRLPIQYALTYPQRVVSPVASLDLSEFEGLTFRKPDMAKFPCLGIGFEVAGEGGTSGAVMNAANDVAVEAFLKSQLKFSGIHRVIRTVLDKHSNGPASDLEAVLATDRWAREEARKCLRSI